MSADSLAKKPVDVAMGVENVALRGCKGIRVEIVLVVPACGLKEHIIEDATSNQQRRKKPKTGWIWVEKGGREVISNNNN